MNTQTVKPADVRIPDSFARHFDQADFYRRGFIDASSGKEPMELNGYPAPLRLAYVSGGLDGLDA